jgi:hypothetical protein
MENTPLVQEPSPQSDVAVAFSVLYNVSPGKARLRVREETRGALLYGVLYQIGIEYSTESRRLSNPLPFDEVRMSEIEGDLYNGEKLIVRMVDSNHNHLAAAGIDLNNWPADLSTDSFQDTKYWLPVPPERLNR